jgi:hypothetical protein
MVPTREPSQSRGGARRDRRTLGAEYERWAAEVETQRSNGRPVNINGWKPKPEVQAYSETWEGRKMKKLLLILLLIPGLAFASNYDWAKMLTPEGTQEKLEGLFAHYEPFQGLILLDHEPTFTLYVATNTRGMVLKCLRKYLESK